MAAVWSKYTLETFIAPGLASFTEAPIPDLTSEFPQAKHWLANHFLNCVLRGVNFADGARQAVIGFLRRSHTAFDRFHKARELTISYLAKRTPSNPEIYLYYDAVSAWEDFALQISMATELLNYLTKDKLFKKNDLSKEHRLYEMANKVKHTKKCIEGQQCTQEDTVPLWLSNDGLCSFSGLTVTYIEAGEILHVFSSIADSLQDPKSFKERMEKVQADPPAI